MIDIYENDKNFQNIKKLSNLEVLKEFEEGMEEKIKSMASVIKFCPALEKRFEIAILNIKPVINEGEETFDTTLYKYVNKN